MTPLLVGIGSFIFLGLTSPAGSRRNWLIAMTVLLVCAYLWVSNRG